MSPQTCLAPEDLFTGTGFTAAWIARGVENEARGVVCACAAGCTLLCILIVRLITDICQRVVSLPLVCCHYALGSLSVC